MPLPTLLTKGNVVIQKWMSKVDKRKAENQVSVEFIIDFIADRMPARRGQQPKVKAKRIGDRVLVLKSGTGSGKSTTLPPYLYNRFDDTLHKNIAITQPRRLTAIDIPYQIIQYNKNLQIEKNIGYQTGIIAKKPVHGITFMTIGVLTQQLKTLTAEEFTKKYMFILIDEVHERDLANEFAIYEIKKFLEKAYTEPDCPFFILMSATFDKAPYMNYFNVPKQNYIEVTGQSFHKEFIYADHAIQDWRAYTVDLVKKIHTSEEGIKDVTGDTASQFRDILVFVNGAGMMKSLALELHKLNTDPSFVDKAGYLGIVSLTSASFAEGAREYQNLFSPIEEVKERVALASSFKTASGGYNWADARRGGCSGGAKMKIEDIKWEEKTVDVARRVIISTNIAETGVTIETLKYCIETGFVISAEFNPTYASHLLLSKNVTQGMSEQRAGRVGRKAPGIVYFLYTKDVLDSFLKDQHPSIISSDITFELLGAIMKETGTELVEVSSDIRRNTKKYPNAIFIQMHNVDDEQKCMVQSKKSFNALDLDFMSYPSADSVQYSLEKLYMLGFITQTGEQTATTGSGKTGNIVPTLLGFLANSLRKISLENIRMMLAGYHHKCNILDLITITACIEVGFRNISMLQRDKYKPVNVLGKSDDATMMHFKLLYADEFIEYIFIWNSYMQTLDKQKSGIINISAIKDWCISANLKYSGLLMVTEVRDEILESFISLGYDPFWNGLGLKRGSYNLADILRKDMSLGHGGMEEIIKIKNCIYEGYRLNIATYNNISKKYVMDYRKTPIDIISSKLISPLTVTNISSDKSDEKIQDRPMKIIVSNILVAPNPFSPGLYSFNAGDSISVLDGFLTDIDDTYISAFP